MRGSCICLVVVEAVEIGGRLIERQCELGDAVARCATPPDHFSFSMIYDYRPSCQGNIHQEIMTYICCRVAFDPSGMKMPPSTAECMIAICCVPHSPPMSSGVT